MLPFATTSCAPMMLSQVSPCCLMASPMPPPSARPCSSHAHQTWLFCMLLGCLTSTGLDSCPVNACQAAFPSLAWGHWLAKLYAPPLPM